MQFSPSNRGSGTVLVILGLVSLVLTSCSKDSASDVHAANAYNAAPFAKKDARHLVSLAGQPNVLSKIVLGRAELRPIDLTIEATAQLHANANSVTRVSAPIAGKVLEVKACLGDLVHKGQLLVTITSQEVGALITDLFRVETEIDSDLAKELMQIEYDSKETSAELALCSKQFERAKKLIDEKIGSMASLEAAQTEVEKHELMIAALQAKKKKAINIAEEKKKMAQVSLEQKLMVLGMPRATINEIMRKRSVVNSVPIHTPQTGIVLERDVNVGELVEPSKSLFVVDDINDLWLVADIFEQDVAHVRVGQNIEFKVDSFPREKFKGKLSFVAGAIDPETRTLPVRAVVLNPDFRLKPKMFARMKIFAERHKVLTIPKQAVQDAGSFKVVYVPTKTPQVFEERRIKVGEESGDFLEVIDGIKPGDSLVVIGSFTLRSQILKEDRKDAS